MLEQIDSRKNTCMQFNMNHTFTNAIKKPNERTNERMRSMLENRCTRNSSQSIIKLSFLLISICLLSCFIFFLSLCLYMGLLLFGQSILFVSIMESNTTCSVRVHTVARADRESILSGTHTSPFMTTIRLSLTILMCAWDTTRSCLSAEIRPRSHVLPDTSTVLLVRFSPLK